MFVDEYSHKTNRANGVAVFERTPIQYNSGHLLQRFSLHCAFNLIMLDRHFYSDISNASFSHGLVHYPPQKSLGAIAMSLASVRPSVNISVSAQ